MGIPAQPCACVDYSYMFRGAEVSPFFLGGLGRDYVFWGFWGLGGEWFWMDGWMDGWIEDIGLFFVKLVFGLCYF